jgi:hypothetical protein
MDTFIEMDFDEWVAEYQPITNHIDKNASFDGLMFETYGEEYEAVKSANPNCIWMYGDGDDGGSYIWSGWGFVNRLGYFITTKPFPDNVTIQIKVSSYWFYCEGCGADIEDDGQLINDKFYEWECCPLCATPEQLKEIEEANA